MQLKFFFLLASLAFADPTGVPFTSPRVNPHNYPPGTVFSVVVDTLKNTVSWAPSQDPELPALTHKDKTPLRLEKFSLLDLPGQPTALTSVERSGGHNTLAQWLYLESLPLSEQRKIFQSGTSVPYENLRGRFVALTVVYEKTPMPDVLRPKVISMKSTQLNNAYRLINNAGREISIMEQARFTGLLAESTLKVTHPPEPTTVSKNSLQHPPPSLNTSKVAEALNDLQKALCP